MAILSKGVDFTTGDQVTATNLDNLVDAATFASGAVDSSTTQLSGGAIIVKDGGITAAKMESGSNGQLFIGTGSGFTKATLTAGTNIGVTNASGAITLAFSGTLPIANGGTGATTAAAARTAIGIETPVKNTASLTRSDTVFTDIPGLTINLVSGTSYTIETTIPWSSTDKSGKFRLTGTATGSSVSGSALQVADTTLQAALATALPFDPTTTGPAGVTAGYFTSSVTIVCDGSGTLKWQFGLVTATGTATVPLGATMKSFTY